MINHEIFYEIYNILLGQSRDPLYEPRLSRRVNLIFGPFRWKESTPCLSGRAAQVGP